MDFWTEAREEELISAWRGLSALYDTSSSAYSNRIARGKATKELAQMMGVTGTEITKKITSLRTQFTRYSRQLPSGSGAVKRTTRRDWMLKSLAFLGPHIRNKQSVSNLDFDLEGTQGEISMVDEENETQTPESPMSIVKSTPKSTTPKQPKRPASDKKISKRKRDDEELTIIKNLASSLQCEPEDDIAIFL